ncbi:MAG: O-antigen ligase family protein, partial [Myxococcales bacterium]|nr:O-antigen ligase family protein [Myxococcales bacterium]
IGLVQKLLGATAIYGLYQPRQDFFGLGQAYGSPLLTTFVNPNHQSALFLIGMFAAAASAVDLRARAIETRSRDGSERLADRAYLAWGGLAIQATALVLSMSRGALLSLLVIMPLVLWLVVQARRPVGSEPGRAGRRRAVQIAVLLLMILIAATQGAWSQLASLRDPQAFFDKFRVAGDALALIPLAPVLGIGRGSFVDAFPLVDTQPGMVQFTHLECTPLAFMVEWGPLPGLALVVGLGLWWIQSFRANAGVARRLGLCGLLALGIQSGADFSMDYLGVAAPAVAMAGALGLSRPTAGWPCKRTALFTAAGALAALALALVSMGSSWSQRYQRDQLFFAEEVEGTVPVAELDKALAESPLDPFVHLALARVHAQAEDWPATLQRAEVAARLRPASLDAQMLAAVAASRVDRPLDAV